MKRLAFNGGEISPQMALRSDMDVYARSCSTLTNFDVFPTGGITRRRGMRYFADAMTDSILIPFKYDETLVYLVELGNSSLIVYNPADASIAFRSESNNYTQFLYTDLSTVSYLQINSLLLICSQSVPVMQLKLNADGSFSFSPFEFKNPPWKTTDLRDSDITISPQSEEDLYSILFDNEDEDEETDPHSTGDSLRASFYTQQTEAFRPASTLKNGLKITQLITPQSAFAVGDKLAWQESPQYEYYICTKDWNGSDDFTNGFISPSNYQENFLLAEDLTGFSSIQPIAELSAALNFKRGDKIIIRSGLWSLFFCIRPFSGSSDFISGYSSPADYPKFFTRGIPVGDAIPCGGQWKFTCSGTWHGSYEVRRNYTTGELTEEWESLGISESPLGAASNNFITGDESEEECYLRLFITSVKFTRANDPGAAWPADFCACKLVVSPYLHHMKLSLLADGFFRDDSTVPIPLPSPRTTKDWSWAAFSSAFGFPHILTIHQSRLFFASTASQPQTIWASRTNDLNNFALSDLDSSALLLEMQTTTQAAICWITSVRNDLLIGTEDAEWICSPSEGSILTAKTATITRQSHIGSSHQPAILSDNGVIYCARGSSRIYEYAYNYEVNGYQSKDLTIFADHIAPDAGGIISGSMLKKPYCALIYVTGSGALLRMSYNTMHNINAWHRYTTEGSVQSACALSSGNASDRLFLITIRSGQRAIEVIDDNSDFSDGAAHFDYTSTMSTTAFSLPDRNDPKVHTSPLQLYIAENIPASAITISTGQAFHKLDRTGSLSTGWHNLTAPADWQFSPSFSLQVSGNLPASFLAIQA